MECLQPNPERLERRHFTPHDINLCDWDQVRDVMDRLMNRPIDSAESLERYFLDVCDLTSALTEETCRIQLAVSVNTADETARERYQHFMARILAPAAETLTALDTRFLESPYVKELDGERYGQLIRLLHTSQDLFRKENIPLGVRDSELSDIYNALAGGLSVEFQGKTRNLSEMTNFQESTDRTLRESAWRTVAACRNEKIDEINAVYSEMISIRTRVARNAGFPDYRAFRHIQLNRFDYQPEDCIRYHDAMEQYAIGPYLERQKKRKSKLGIDVLRPWDLHVDVDGNQPLQPFSRQAELVTRVTAILDRIYPNLGDTLRLLEHYGHLDLMTRQNKSPVGFNMPLDETRVSFIFMNATGQHSDVIVLLHESGHAIETRACIDQAITHYRHTPQEWGECASQSIEMLALDHLDVLYPDPAIRKRCIIDKLDSILWSLIATARIDAFQHWVYTHPDHSDDERADRWLELSHRFPTGAAIDGLEHLIRWQWQSIPHLFIVPFYYIEYGIAQLAAIQVYRKVRQSGFNALERWFETMRLGHSVSIPELYRRAGLQFRFHGEFAGELIRFITDEIDRIESC
ncbi:M3 family oligoendopeptidase [bacterium]|nr:M3 family oligoendopeptidase [candidate division CSSED10-310 bacterium]